MCKEQIIKHLKEEIGFDNGEAEEFLKKIKETVNTYAQEFEDIKRSLFSPEGKDPSSFSSFFHKLKGVFLNLGLVKQAELAKAIEINLKSGNLPSELLKEFEEILQNILKIS